MGVGDYMYARGNGPEPANVYGVCIVKASITSTRHQGIPGLWRGGSGHSPVREC